MAEQTKVAGKEPQQTGAIGGSYYKAMQERINKRVAPLIVRSGAKSARRAEDKKIATPNQKRTYTRQEKPKVGVATGTTDQID